VVTYLRKCAISDKCNIILLHVKYMNIVHQVFLFSISYLQLIKFTFEINTEGKSAWPSIYHPFI